MKFFSDNKKLLRIVSVLSLAVMGMIYFSVVARSALGGDDRINWIFFNLNVRDYTFFECVSYDLTHYIKNINPLNTSRYMPFAACSALTRKYIYSSVILYRYWISFYTVLNIVVLAYLIWRIVKKDYILYLSIILGIISVNIWRSSGLNPMVSYEALTQRCFLWSLLCLHFYWTWLQDGKLRYVVIGNLFLLCSCLTYEIGYMTVLYVFLLMLFRNSRSLLEYIKGTIPAIVATIIAGVLYELCAITHGPPEVDTSVVLAPNAIFLCLIKQINSSFPINGILHSGFMMEIANLRLSDIAIPLIFSVVVFMAIFRIRELPDRKFYLRAILLGSAFVILPASLISITVKFQDGPYTTWETGWIVTLVGSFGLGIIGVSLALAAVDYFKEIYHSRILQGVVALILSLGVLFTGTYSHMATRESIDSSYNNDHFSVMLSALEDGLMDDIDENALVLSNYYVWGESKDAVQGLFKRFSENSSFESYTISLFEDEQYVPEDTFYFDSPVNEGTACAFVGRFDDINLDTISDVKIYISDKDIDKRLRFVTYESGDKAVVKCDIGSMEMQKCNNGFFIRLENGNIKRDSIKILP